MLPSIIMVDTTVIPTISLGAMCQLLYVGTTTIGYVLIRRVLTMNGVDMVAVVRSGQEGFVPAHIRTCARCGACRHSECSVAK